MNVSRIVLNETSYFGSGARSVLANEFLKRGFKKALVVTDKSLIKAGVAEMVLEVLDTEFIEYEIYSDIKPNPTVESVKTGVKKFKKANADCLIAIGGGSVIDVSKAIGIIVTNPEHEDVVSLEGAVETKNKSVPIIALPTTAGTAAEVTINYVITDEASVKKMVCVDPHDIPVLSIVDSELMESMPKSLAAATGMDALTHAIEGYITKGSWSMTDMFHLEAIKMIFANLEKAVNEKDKEAISNMALAQYIAGMGFSNVGLGIVHSMAHQLGAVYDTPHGVANAVLLPYVMEFNGEVCVEKYENIGRAIGLEMDALTRKEIVERVVNAVKELSKKVGIPEKMRYLDVKKEDIKMLSKKAILDPCTPGNPREVSEEEIEKIYERAF